MRWLSKRNQRLLLEHLDQPFIKEYGTAERMSKNRSGHVLCFVGL